LRGERLRLGRYLFVGVAVSLGYTTTVIGLIEGLGWSSPGGANAVSFALWTPVSYLAHREFTFRSGGEYVGSGFRFGITFLVKFLTSVIIMAVVTNYIDAHYLAGVLLNWVAVPLVTYIVLDLWVFSHG
jgi:putative flippase GtrA